MQTVAGDLNHPDSKRRLADAGTGIDILPNNAGILTYAPLLETPASDCIPPADFGSVGLE